MNDFKQTNKSFSDMEPYFKQNKIHRFENSGKYLLNFTYAKKVKECFYLNK